MIDFTCYVLEDIMQRGMYMAHEQPDVPGCRTWPTHQDAEDYLWSRDCLITMGYAVERVELIETEQDRMGGL